MTSEWSIALAFAAGIMLGYLIGSEVAHPDVKPIMVDTSNLEAI